MKKRHQLIITTLLLLSIWILRPINSIDKSQAQELVTTIDCTEGSSSRHECFLAWNPHKNWLAVRDFYDIVIWDMDIGEKIAIFTVERRSPDVLVWNAEGNLLASADGTYHAYIWYVESGEMIRTINFETLLMDDFNEGRIEGPFESIESLSWHPDGTKIAVAHNGSISIWNLETDDLTLIQSDIAGTEARTVLWSLDGSQLVVVNFGKLTLYDASTYQPTGDDLVFPDTYGLSGGINAPVATWDSDEENIAVAVQTFNYSGFAQVVVYDMATGDVVQTLETEGYRINALAWNPTLNLLASANGDWMNNDENDKSVRIWDMDTHELIEVFEYDDYPLFVAWNFDGTLLAITTADGTIEIRQFE